MANSSPLLARAHALDGQGRLTEAVALYEQVIKAEPRNSDALHLMGIALARMGRPTDAAGVLTAAVDIQPGNAAMLTNLGKLLSEIGRHADASAYLERALNVSPNLVAAHRARGVALLRQGLAEPAVKALQTALRLAPKDPHCHVDLGAALEQLGKRDDALRHFDRAIELDPGLAQAHHNRGLIEISLGRKTQALVSLERAVALAPRHAAIHSNRGNVLSDLERFEEALASYDIALTLQPGDASVLRHRGRVLLTLEKYTDALASFEAATAARPQDFETAFLRGVALMHLDRHEEAIESFDRALAGKADFSEALNNRGISLVQLDRPDAALASFSAALQIVPADVNLNVNIGNTLRTLQRFPDALEHLNRALAGAPQVPELAWGKALTLLTMGDFDAGLPLHESRLELRHLRPLQRHSHLPKWNFKETLEGETLLIHAEQGLGDTLQFCRYVPMIEARGIDVVFEVQPQLKKLLRTLAMKGEIIGVGEKLPSFDVRVPLLSLPLAFATRLDTIPAKVPYLGVDEKRHAEWRARLAALPGFKIGLAWQGNLETEKQGGFRGRSFELEHAAALARVPGATLISLQKGYGAGQRASVSFADELLQLTNPDEMGADEFIDTAALVKSLDLVITSDTVTAHLAGALAVPVWVLLGRSPDWRWLTQRSDTPWYPTMRLFRQSRLGDWDELFARVAAELAAQCSRLHP